MLEDEFFLGTKLYAKQFAQICKPIVDYLDITSFYYCNVDQDGRAFNIYSLQNWGEHVLEKQYYKTELGLVHPKNIHGGFTFANASDDEEYKDGLLHDGAVNFNWWHAFSYVEKTHFNGGYWTIGLGTTRENYKIMDRLANESQLIRGMLKGMNKQLLSKIHNLEDNRMDAAALKGEAFYQQKGLIYHEDSEQKHKVKLLKNMGLITGEDLLTKPQLSKQEINCLRIYMLDQNIKAVARELDLAVTTVSSYIENIKNKLNCNFKSELLDKAIILQSLGMI